nr:protein trichome birefringence-like 34 [Tanacetum cinerariifolium]
MYVNDLHAPFDNSVWQESWQRKREQMASLLPCNRPNPPEAHRPLLKDFSCNYFERCASGKETVKAYGL